MTTELIDELASAPFELVDFAAGTPFSRYCEDVVSFCPFLGPAHDAGMLYQLAWRLPAGDWRQQVADVFYAGTYCTEAFRRLRRRLPPRQARLFCLNVVFLPTGDSSVDGKQLFGWPHFCLKTLYTEVEVMFGKFWRGERILSRAGVPIPEPVCEFLSIRSLVKPRDPYFFGRAAHLLPEAMAADDDGRDVHLAACGAHPPLDSVADMRSGDYYAHVKARIMTRIPGPGTSAARQQPERKRP